MRLAETRQMLLSHADKFLPSTLLPMYPDDPTPVPSHLPALLPSPTALLRRAQGTLGLLREVVQESSAEYWYEQLRKAYESQNWIGVTCLFLEFNSVPSSKKLDYSKAYYFIGYADYKLSNYETSLSNFNYSINLNDSFYDAYLGRGNVKEALKNYNGALADYSFALQFASNDHMEPEEGEAYVSRARIRYIMQDYQGAISDYSGAILSMVCGKELYYLRGQAKLDLKDYRGALEDFDEAIRQNFYYMKAQNKRAFVKEILGDVAGARYIRKVISNLITDGYCTELELE